MFITIQYRRRWPLPSQWRWQRLRDRRESSHLTRTGFVLASLAPLVLAVGIGPTTASHR